MCEYTIVVIKEFPVMSCKKLQALKYVIKLIYNKKLKIKIQKVSKIEKHRISQS